MVRRLNIGDKVSFAILSAVLCFGLVLLVGMVLDWFKAENLVSRGRPMYAQIDDVGDYPKHQGRFAEYSFDVGRVRYTGTTPFKPEDGDMGGIHITYLPDDPSFSALHPKEVASNARGGVLTLVVFCGVAGLLLRISRLQMKRKQQDMAR